MMTSHRKYQHAGNMTLLHPDCWQVVKLGNRWVLQELRKDASKPYWLTYRIYMTGSEARLKMKRLLMGKNIDV